MLLSGCVICFCLLLAEANRIGQEEDGSTATSLKAEILQFKTSECGSSSSEESYEKSRKRQASDESDSSDNQENTKKRRRNKNDRHRNGGSPHSGDYESQGYNYGQAGPGRSSGRNPYQQPQCEDSYPPRNMGRPSNEQYPSRGGLPYPAMEQDPYHRPGGTRPYGGRPEMSYPDRGTGRYPYQNGQETFPNRELYSGARNPYQNRQDSREAARNSHHGSGHFRQKHGSKRKSNKKPVKDDSDEECVSQCIFNNMDIMEDDGIPSESAMIKWAQEKIKNDKLKSAAVREIRKCFGTLASSGNYFRLSGDNQEN